MKCFLSEWALKSVSPSNVLLYDAKDMPSVMVRIPKMTVGDLLGNGSSQVHPAFIVNGEEKECIYISKYQNCIINDLAYSLPGATPSNSNAEDTEYEACEGKGIGWHVMTIAEYGLVSLLCQKLGTKPLGNNNYGKDKREGNITGVVATYRSSDGMPVHLLTGSGPLSYSHDYTQAGIYDLNGNVNERIGGIRIFGGELQILDDNDSADLENTPGSEYADWKAIDASTGDLVTPDGSGTTTNSIKVDKYGDNIRFDTSVSTRSADFYGYFRNISAGSGVSSDAIMRLVLLGLYPYQYSDVTDLQRHYYGNTANSAFYMTAGGNYAFGNAAGVFCRKAYNKGYVTSGVGFRSAYVEL